MSIASSIFSQFINADNLLDLSDSTRETHEIIPLEKIKENALRHALKVTKGNIQEAARRLQIGRATIYRMLKEYNIKIDKDE